MKKIISATLMMSIVISNMSLSEIYSQNNISLKSEEVIEKEQSEEVVEKEQSEEVVEKEQSEEVVEKEQSEEVVEKEQSEEVVEKEQSEEANKDENNVVIGEKYDKITNKYPMKLKQTNIAYLPKEYNSDIERLGYLTYLKTKTDFKYEVALAKSNGDYEYIDASNNIEECINISNGMQEKLKSEGIYSVIDDKGNIVYATKSMGRIIKYINGYPYNKNDINTNVYSDESKKDAYTYINHGYVDDVPIIENNGKMARIEVAGYTGWVDSDTTNYEYDLTVVPINQVKNPSYYTSINGELIHYISSDITSDSKSGYNIKLGPAPSFMKDKIKYYSYDSKFFYNDLDTLLDDLKNYNNNNSINHKSPFYMYYTHLPFRTKTVYTASQIDNYINNNTPEGSKLRGMGKTLIEKQNKYGANALTVLGIAMNESAKGTSNIAKTKNNLFGINAIDSDTGNATTFNSVEDCIDQFTKYYISKGYADPEDWRYRGGNLGYKDLGANVKYASDPFWGEKAARYSYEADYYISGRNIQNLKDYNRYQLGIYESSNEVRDKNKNVLYYIREGVKSNSGNVGNPVVISSIDKFSDNQRDYWYEISPERNDSGALNNYEFDGLYQWSGKGYIKSEYIKLINNGRYQSDSDDITVTYQAQGQDYGWQDWVNEGEVAGTVNQWKRMEGIKIKLENKPRGMTLKYRIQGEDYGWQDWVNEGEVAGTEGQAKRAEAIQIKLEGAPTGYHIEYRVQGEDYGWQDWKRDGEVAGTIGEWKRMESIQIRLVKETNDIGVSYQAQGESYWWQDKVSNGAIAGTVNQWKRMEGIRINLDNAPEGMSIKYRVQGEDYGWQDWVNEGEVAGTEGQAKRAEAIQIKLEGAPTGYHIEYRVHGEDYGWQDWKRDGEIAGTVGEWKRIEAIQVRLYK